MSDRVVTFGGELDERIAEVGGDHEEEGVEFFFDDEASIIIVGADVILLGDVFEEFVIFAGDGL